MLALLASRWKHSHAEEGGQTAARGLSRLWYHPVTQVQPPGHSHA